MYYLFIDLEKVSIISLICILEECTICSNCQAESYILTYQDQILVVQSVIERKKKKGDKNLLTSSDLYSIIFAVLKYFKSFPCEKK